MYLYFKRIGMWTFALLSLFPVSSLGSWKILPSGVNFNLFCDTGHSPKEETFTKTPRSIGRLFFDGKTQCTATLVDPGDVIMTAAHCVEDDNGKILTNKFQFITGGSNDTQGERVDIDATKIMVGTKSVATEAKGDIAFLKLKRTLDKNLYPPAKLAPLGTTSIDEKKYLTGYFHSDSEGSEFNDRPTTESCEVDKFDPKKPVEDNFFFNCGATPEMSGAPYYAYRHGNLVALGVYRGQPHPATDVIPYSSYYANKASDGYAALEVYARFRQDFP